jgi:serine/threonine protein kinase
MDIFQLIPHISSMEAAIQFLREIGILRSLDHPPLCPICHESYLDEFQWRQLYGKKTPAAFDNILRQISVFYPVNN